MDKELKIYKCEFGRHEITNYHLIYLRNENRETLLIVPIGEVPVNASPKSIFDEEDISAPVHKVFLDVVKSLGGTVQKIVIDDLKKGMFFATLYYIDIDCNQFTVRAEAVDAIAISLFMSCPLYVLESVIETANHDSLNCVCWYDPEDKETLNKVRALPHEKLVILPLHDLKQLIEIAADIEDYEFAARLKKAHDLQVRLKDLIREVLSDPKMQKDLQTSLKKTKKVPHKPTRKGMKGSANVKSTTNPIKKKDDGDSKD